MDLTTDRVTEAVLAVLPEFKFCIHRPVPAFNDREKVLTALCIVY